MKTSTLLLFILLVITGHAQNTATTTINNFKYVLLPEKFDFLKYEDQYGLNTTAKVLLENKGFLAFVNTGSLPPELAANKCLALRAEVTERNGLFATRLTLLLKDCYGNVIFKSKEGKSSEKEFPVAYDGALRDAFVSLNSVAYKYDSSTAVPPQQLARPQQQTPQQQQQTPLPQQVAVTPTAPPPAPTATTPAGATPSAPVSTKPAAAELTGTLYAQPTPNGYQLVDTTPRKILTLLKTSVQDFFIADAGGNSGIVFKRNGEWFFERYEDNKLVSQKLDIKF